MRCPTSLYAVVPHGPHKDKLRLAEPIKWSMYLPSRPILRLAHSFRLEDEGQRPVMRRAPTQHLI